MSDRSSESSGEWIILNEDEEALALDNEQSLNLELSYDAICHAVSDSIRSSFSSEDFEWQYEQYNHVPPHRPFFIQELDIQDSDTNDCESEDSNAEDDAVNKCASTSSIAEDDVDIAAISKIHSYKHNRNDHLNFILNFTLALVLASAMGLGFGHFLGWSHKCFKSASINHKTIDNSFELPKAVIIEQKNEVIEHFKKDESLPLYSENLLNSVSCTSLKVEDSSANNDICNSFINSNIVIDSGLTETQILMNSDVLTLNAQIPQNFSDYELSVDPASNIVQNIDFKFLSNTEAAVKNIHTLKEVTSDNVAIDSPTENEISDIELESLSKIPIKEIISKKNDVVYESETHFSVDENDNLAFENKLNDNEFEFMKDYFNEEKISSRENNLTNQLRKDLNEVVQSLAAIALARLSEVNEKYSIKIENSQSVMKLFSEFQTLINTRITDIDNFISSLEYKNDPKFSIKYLQKMVYTLVDSVDYLMKTSFKTLSKDGKKINVLKFSNNISKIIINFNKRWEKNNRFWSESFKKLNVNKIQGDHFKKVKENKHWKNKAQFERNNKKIYKYRR